MKLSEIQEIEKYWDEIEAGLLVQYRAKIDAGAEDAEMLQRVVDGVEERLAGREWV